MTLILPQKGLWSNSLEPLTFDMTSGSLFETVVGYNVEGNLGSISSEPLAGETLINCDDQNKDGEFRLFFDGDVTSLLSGYTEVYIDGSLAYSGGKFESPSSATRFQINGSIPSTYGFNFEQTYSIEIR